jgi:hypothetical protein
MVLILNKLIAQTFAIEVPQTCSKIDDHRNSAIGMPSACASV